jgi:cobalt-zinc-cadmium efflux system membrane fusion protein
VRRANFVLLVLIPLVLLLGGCGQPTGQLPADTHSVASDHSGWWCAEHGVPEEECTRCDASLVAGFKAKGDWCDQHERPDSQCFHCHPEHEARFAARYEAKFGKKPPAPTDP